MMYKFLLSALLFIVVTNCDNTIDPFENELGTFSMYGALDTALDTNVVRIKYIDTPFLTPEEALRPIEATLEDIESGVIIPLEEKRVNFRGQITRNFTFAEDLLENKEYRLQVSDNNGKTSESVIRMPGQTQEPTIFPPVNCTGERIILKFQNVKPDEYLRVEAGFHLNGGTIWAELKTVDQFEAVPGEDAVSATYTVNNMLIEAFPPISDDILANVPPRFWFPDVGCADLDDLQIQIRYIHFGPDWVSIRDSNQKDIDYFESGEIENGAGIVGGIRRGLFSFRVQFP